MAAPWEDYQNTGEAKQLSQDEIMTAVKKASSKTGIPEKFIYGQWAHETGNFQNRGAKELNNLAGITNPGGDTKGYRGYASLDAFVDDYSNLVNSKYKLASAAQSPEAFVRGLRGWFTDNPQNYIAGVKRASSEYQGQEQDPWDYYAQGRTSQPSQVTTTPVSTPQGPEGFIPGLVHGGKMFGLGIGQTVLQGGEAIRQALGMQSNQANVDRLQSIIDAERKSFEGADTSASIGNLVGGVAPTLLMPGTRAVAAIPRILSNAAQGATIGGLQATSGDESRLKNTAYGAAAAGGTGAAFEAIKRAVPAVLGTTTGAGQGAIEEAYKATESFRKALHGETTGEEVVSNAKAALSKIVEKRGNEYRQKLAIISENKSPINLQEIKDETTAQLKNYVKYTEEPAMKANLTKPAGGTWVAVPHPSGGGFAVKNTDTGQFVKGQGGHSAFYSSEKQAINSAIYETEQAAKLAKKAAENAQRPEKVYGKFNWSRTSVGDIKTSKDAKELKTIYDKIQNWGSQPGDNTAIELDRLRRDLDNFYSESSRVRAFVANARNIVNKAINKNVPEYEQMTKKYAEATGLIKAIDKSLSIGKSDLGGKATPDQTLRRLTSAMRENFEMRRELLDVLGNKGGDDIAGQVAGYAMNQLMPKGLIGKVGAGGAATMGAYLHPYYWSLIAASSPRVAGEFLQVFGRAAKIARPITKTIPAAAQKTGAVVLTQPGSFNASPQITEQEF